LYLPLQEDTSLEGMKIIEILVPEILSSIAFVRVRQYDILVYKVAQVIIFVGVDEEV
jgi:hypothetical protein